MTIGIYCLHFKGTDKVYIGKSKHIEKRFTDHLYKLSKNEGSEKLQQAYLIFGPPTIEIILECCEEELSSFEVEAIEIYNSYQNGFNSTLGGEAGGIGKPGPDNGNAIYTKEQIIKCFTLLVSSNKLFTEIESITGIAIPNINLISAGTRHQWLKDMYPTEYNIMLSKKGTRNSSTHSAAARGITYPTLLSPEGKEFTVTNIRSFAKEYNLDAGNLGKVLRKQVNQHRGWKVKHVN